MKTILIFEPLAGGHRAGFVRWLVEAIREDPPADRRFVVVVDHAAEGVSADGVVFERIPKETAASLAAADGRRLSWLLWRLFRESCDRFKPDHALILELTHLELPLALRGAPCPVSAILFVQYPELRRGLKFILKEWKTALLLRRATVRNLFLLNGETGCRYLTNRFGSSTRFIPVPDPAPPLVPEAGWSLHREYNIDPGRTAFLFFGVLSPRKGADVLIEALRLLSPEGAARSAFVFCGRPEQGYRAAFERGYARLRTERADLRLHWDDRFVPDGRMMALFEQADVILMPYTRPEYSSGILALAAKARTPVLGPEGGLLGPLIRQNGLGAACPIRPASVARGIEESSRRVPAVDEARRDAFAGRSLPGHYAQAILGALRHEV